MPGKQFVAITDPGSKMEQIAKGDGFRYIFYGKPEIGGRFSAFRLWADGCGGDGSGCRGFLYNAAEMVEACQIEDPSEIPEHCWGRSSASATVHGRDKLTIFTSPEIYDLGAWLEQLIAESTGKNDIAIIPVDREPILDGRHYGDDRVFVSLSVKGAKTDEEFTIGLQANRTGGASGLRGSSSKLSKISAGIFPLGIRDRRRRFDHGDQPL